MFSRRILGVRGILKLSCIALALAPATVCGQDSIQFNGSTSKLENAEADVFAVSSNEVTICVWVYGANSTGHVIRFDELGSKLILAHHTAPHTLTWVSAVNSGASGQWTFPATDGQWNAVAVTHDRVNQIRKYRVNFDTADETPVTAPGTGVGVPLAGYSVGPGWNGKIAHIQVFDRILTDEEMDACLRVPGSVRKGLRLWLAMTHAGDIYDRSRNGFHGVPTALATATDGPVLVNPLSVSTGIVQLPLGYTHVTQHVIPTFADGVKHPGGQLRGSGPGTVIVATAATESLPSATEAVVITEDYGVANMSQWQNGTDGQEYPDAMLCPVICDLTIAGYDPTEDNYANDGSDVNSEPWLHDDGKMPKYDLLRVRGNGAEVRNVKLFYCPGTAMVIFRDVNAMEGPVGEFDREVNTISDVCFNRVYRGIEIRSVDHQIAHVEGTRWRDFGLKASDHHQLHDIHVYGGGDYGIWLEGDGNQLTNSYPEHVSFGPEELAIGLYVEGNQNVIKSLRSHNCAGENVRMAGSSNVVVGFWIGDPTDAGEVNPLGFLLSGQENQISNGRIDVKANGTGIKITNGERHTIRDVILNSLVSHTTTGIDAEATLNNCKIDVLIFGGAAGVGLDLLDSSTSRLGVGNNITIQATDLGAAVELIDLPSTWDKSNRIVVGGMRIRGTITNIVHGSPNTTITAPSHGLQNTNQIAIGGALGTNVNSSTGTYHTITRVDDNTFTIPVAGSGTYTAGTGYIGEWITK